MSMRAYIAFSILALGMLRPVGATILTFDGLRGPTGGSIQHYDAISQAYGDNVNGPSDAAGNYLMGNAWTPNVTTAFTTRDGTSNTIVFNQLDWWDTNYGDLVNIAFPAQNGGAYGQITLTAAPGWRVRLNSFDEAGYSQSDHTGQTVSVTDGTSNTILFSESPTTIRGANGTHSTFTPNVDGSVLFIRYAYNDWNVGIDNVNFDQIPAESQVPEPGTFGLAALAGLALPLLFRVRKAR
jgi:hypothetical protein